MDTSIQATAAVTAYLKAHVPGGSMPPDDLPTRVDRDQVIRLATEWMWDRLGESDDPAFDLASMISGFWNISWADNPHEALLYALEDLEGRESA